MPMTKPTSEQVTFLAAGSGASQRTVLDKLRDVVSVKDFGAVGDGVTNDTTAFTNAIAAAGIRDIFVPGGTYVITGTLTGNFYSDATVTISGGTVNTINRIGSSLSTAGNATINGTLTSNSRVLANNSTVTGIRYDSGNTIGIACAGAVDAGIAALTIAVPAGQSVRFDCGSAKFVQVNDGGGYACLAFAEYQSSTVSLVSNPSSVYTNATGTANRISITKAATSHTIRVMNEFTSTRNIGIAVFGSTPSSITLGV
jgi:polygalacturonase